MSANLSTVNAHYYNKKSIEGISLLASTNERMIMEGHDAPFQISVPDIQQQKLSFCDGSLDGFEGWAKKLPMANVGAAAKMLFQATRELNVTQLKASHRYKMLEIIRSQVYGICELLSKRFLQQSVMLSDNDLKIVTLAQTLQNQLATGYKRIILDELQEPSKKSERKLLTFAIHRALTDLSQTILRSMQLYSAPPKNAWLEIHQLYLLADEKDIHQYSVKDSRAKYVASSNVTDIYLRILLMGCSKPNQLRQVDLANLYAATELWSSLVKLSHGSDNQALFLFNQHKDTLPAYRSLVNPSIANASCSLSLNTLVLALQKHINKETSALTIPKNISDSILNHVVSSWGATIERSFRRTQNSAEIQIGIGLLSSHFYAANEQSFPFLLKQWDAQVEEKKEPKANDVWDKSFDAGNNFGQDTDNIAFDSIDFISKHGEEEADDGPQGKQLNAQVINTSPFGYGITLDNPPSSVQTGELVVIKEERMNHWSLGCIRWIRTQRNKATQLGIELLSPKVEAVAVRILNKTGENGEYLRGICIPALPAADQQETLILPTLPFKIGSKVQWQNDKVNQRIQLLKRVNTSRSFVQYTFQTLTQVLNTSTNNDDAGDEFASIWDKL